MPADGVAAFWNVSQPISTERSGASGRLETKVVKRIDVEEYGDEERHLQPLAKCPACGVWGDIDYDQLAGRVSLICGECGWHGYIGGETA